MQTRPPPPPPPPTVTTTTMYNKSKQLGALRKQTQFKTKKGATEETRMITAPTIISLPKNN